MVVLIIFPIILQTVINFRMLSIGGWGGALALKFKLKTNEEIHKNTKITIKAR